MKLEKLILVNENGEKAEILRADYVKHVIKDSKVKPFEQEESGTTEPSKVVNHILKALENGQDVNPEIAAEYGELVKRIESDIKNTVDSKADKKKEAEEAKAKKEAERKEREEQEAKKAEELKLTQAVYAEKVAEGAALARQEFAEELKLLKESLPEGVSTTETGAGIGITFGSDATKETLGQTLGYILQKAENSTFIGNQLHFWIGDTISASVARGFYATAKEAGKHIAAVISEKTGKTVQPLSLDQYKRMAERTPIEFRNPKADPTAYLALSAVRTPRKEEKETDDNFKKRIDKFNEDVAEAQKKLAVGEITSRKEAVVLANEIMLKHGLKKSDDPNAPQISITAQMAIVFHTTFALENLLDVHKEGFATYKTGDTIYEVSKEELEEKRSVAMGHLINALYTNEKASLKPADFIRGYVEKTVNVKVADGQDGKPVMEPQVNKQPVFPIPFWQIEKKEEPKTDAPAGASTNEASSK